MLQKRISALLAVASVLFATTAHAQIKIGVITSSSGPVAMVGIPQKNTIPLLPAEIGGQRVDYISLDDGSDPTATVSAVKKLIGEEHVDAIIGPSGSPNAMGIIGFIAEAKLPLLASVGTAAVVLPMTPQKKWIFKTTPNDDVIARVLVDHMASTGVRTVGFIGTADAYGENWLKVFGGLAAAKDIKVVASESFQRSDTSLTAQGLKTMIAKPDAVLIAAPGSSAVLPQTTLVDQGYRGKLYQTHGAAFEEFLKLGGKKVEGTVLAASGFVVVDELPDTSPIKSIGQRYAASYQKLYGSRPGIFGLNVYDAGILLQAAIPVALKTAKPGTPEFRSALRDALEAVKDLPATMGLYTMTPEDHSGLDNRGVSLITVKDGHWALLR